MSLKEVSLLFLQIHRGRECHQTLGFSRIRELRTIINSKCWPKSSDKSLSHRCNHRYRLQHHCPLTALAVVSGGHQQMTELCFY